MTQTKHKGIVIETERLEHNKKKGEHKLTVAFALNGSKYSNKTIIPADISEKDERAEITKLIAWAKTIINENQV